MATQKTMVKGRSFTPSIKLHNAVILLLASLVTPFLWLSLTQTAIAHHAMGGRLPQNHWDGFLSGLAHPVIGIDHLAFVIAVGLIAIRCDRGVLLSLLFPLTAIGGTLIHLQKLDLPFNETWVALSVVALGWILLRRQRLGLTQLADLVMVAGVFHGYAYGESIVGAETAPIVAYLAGFAVIQAAIVLAIHHLGKRLAAGIDHLLTVEWIYGIAACGLGTVFLVQSLQS